MAEPSPGQRTAPVSRRSRLVPAGWALVALAIVVPRPLWSAAEKMEPGALRSLTFIATDVFRLCFFVGVACLVIGALRNRRRRREAAARAAVPGV